MSGGRRAPAGGTGADRDDNRGSIHAGTGETLRSLVRSGQAFTGWRAPAWRSALAPRLDDDASARRLDPLPDHAAFGAWAVVVAVAPVAIVARTDADLDAPARADMHVLAPGRRRDHHGRDGHHAENHLTHRCILHGSPDAHNAGPEKMFRIRVMIAREIPFALRHQIA